NLPVLDSIKPTGVPCIRNPNETNGGYAADCYACVKRIGALITTFGVSELSTIITT
ncbi:hypothetical protein COCSADRAFT_98419, partial [Bipolaris sorokiniana ND90Pr]